MKIIDCVQGSKEWLAARCGIPSSSNFDKLITSKGEPSKQREKYMYQLAAEAITGCKEESFQSAAMTRGIEMEAEARQFYELTRNVEVEQVGFCLDDSGLFGASPDGLIEDDGLIEIKSPQSQTCVSYLLKGGLDVDYFQQTQGQLLVTGRKYVDLISYYPLLRPLVIRVVRDEKFLKALRVELEVFCKELKEIIEKIK